MVQDMLHHPGEGGEDEHEMGCGGGDVEGKTEKIREHRHVDEPSADPHEAGETANEEADDHAKSDVVGEGEYVAFPVDHGVDNGPAMRRARRRGVGLFSHAPADRKEHGDCHEQSAE